MTVTLTDFVQFNVPLLYSMTGDSKLLRKRPPTIVSCGGTEARVLVRRVPTDKMQTPLR